MLNDNAISWVRSDKGKPWKLHFYFNEINFWLSTIQVEFQHVGRSANGLVDSLAKQGIYRFRPWEVVL